jgi:ABC-type enterochelin transport system ATPase subunit
LMKEGKIWQQGSPESMLRKEVLSQLYEAPISVPAEIASSFHSSQ